MATGSLAICRDQYVIKHNLFADAMRKGRPPIYIIIVPGGFVDKMTTGQGIFIARPTPDFDRPERDWAYGMLKHSMGQVRRAGTTPTHARKNKRFDLKIASRSSSTFLNLSPAQAASPHAHVATMADAWENTKHFPVR